MIRFILIVFFSIQTLSASVVSPDDPDYAGRENHQATRRLSVDLITVEQGAFVRPAKFESWRSVYWVKPYVGATSIQVNVTAANNINVSFKQDGLKKTATSHNGIFGASFALNNGKAMTEIEIIITDGESERSYYLDVCPADPQRHDIVADYYDLLPYPQTRNTTRALVDQIMYSYTITPKRIDFIANNLVGSQKNLRQLIDPVKAINPGWHSLHYHLSIWNGEAPIIINNTWSGEEWQYITNTLYHQDPYIFMYAVDKNTGKTTWLKDFAWGAYLMNISNETYYQYLLNNLVYQCQSTGYESVFFDSFALGIIYSFTKANYINHGAGSNVPSQFTEFQHPQLGGLTWLQAFEEFISRMNKDLNRNGIWLLPNHGQMRTTWDPLDYALTNGGMLEGVPMRPDNSGNMTDASYLGDWILSLSRTMYLTQKDRVIILQPSLDNINDLNYRLFVIGEYLMVRGDYTYINLNVKGQSQASWYPEYEIDLGAPAQTYIIPDTLFVPRKTTIDKALLNYQEGDLFIRRFEKGLVILNPHRTERQYTMPTNRTYKKAVITGGGTVPETGIENLTYSLQWTDVPSGSITVPAVGAIILRYDDTNTGLAETITEKVRVYAADGVIHIISYASNPIREVAVYDLQGRILYLSGSLDVNSHTVHLNQPADMYFVKVISAKDSETFKIFHP